MPDPAGVTIALVTYRRPAELAVALPLVIREATSVVPRAAVLVVDNDPEASAFDVVQWCGSADVRYVREPIPGIAAARNRAMAEAQSSRFLVFIDDDEHPEPGWLAALLATQVSTNAGAVAGRVVSSFEVEPERWIAEGGFFSRRNPPTGTPIDMAATNNLLLDLSQVRPIGLVFDGALGLTGGSDTLFTRSLARHGVHMVWCAEAIVVDRVPIGRLSREWVLRKAFRTGNSATLVSLALCTSAPERLGVRIAATAGGAARVVVGALWASAGTLSGSIRLRARGRRTISRGAGMVAGACGRVLVEYARGSPRAHLAGAA